MSIILSPEAPALVIGAAGIDIMGRLVEPLQAHSSNPARIRYSYGGVARNVAENLGRLGQQVRLITAVGAGPKGDQLLEYISQAGVDVGAAIRTQEHPTGSYIGILSDANDIHLSIDDMRAISTITPAYLRSHYHLFKDASLLFVDANLPKKTLRTAISQAKRAKIPVFADPTTVGLTNRLQPYLPDLFLITPNAAEAAQLCDQNFNAGDPEQPIEAAKHLVSQGVRIAIITLAEFGVCYATSETSGFIQAINTELLDPTGAGDALTAAVIFALLNDISLDDALRLGVSAASLTLRHPGAVLPDLSLEKLYKHLVI